jgi:hypothetical protein
MEARGRDRENKGKERGNLLYRKVRSYQSVIVVVVKQILPLTLDMNFNSSNLALLDCRDTLPTNGQHYFHFYSQTHSVKRPSSST